jgi:hypothetical protein
VVDSPRQQRGCLLTLTPNLAKHKAAFLLDTESGSLA